jgi:hypothetical protein
MAQGFVQVERAVVLIVRSNAPWRLTIRSSRGNLYMTPGRFKPVEHFQWRVAGGTFHAVDHAPAQVACGEGGAGTVRVEVDYRMILNWTDTPPGDWMFEPDYFVEPDEGGFLP